MGTPIPTVVLVHGLAILRRADAMFTGIAEGLEAKGFRVARTFVQGDGTLEALADRLWKQLEPLSGDLALVCHSMGGLQARTFLLDGRRAERLRAIVTLGSPHRGTALARAMAPVHHAYRDMTPTVRSGWAQAYGAAEEQAAARYGVRCLSVVARVRGLARTRQLVASQAMVSALEGPNDGLVPCAAQRWGTVAFEVDLDHWECAAIGAKGTNRARALETWARMAELAVGSDPARDAAGPEAAP